MSRHLLGPIKNLEPVVDCVFCVFVDSWSHLGEDVTKAKLGLSSLIINTGCTMCVYVRGRKTLTDY